ncbi:hypothetical protein E4U34_001714 [Claviceps purpurea]|nr:hypothetical protein E4U38_002618 [Claviceps purpurea]KAG6154658.1 hypothetical protein E4U37_001867 [Claviceps purpurea]KAG6174036.1 hypothetical protein E4U51_003450 [Claviceps purpurea]KAG6221978.1 hypothetical protein E4U34_001714 [Claviceps purpurea]KAG6223496.1 hypothetical protein E4U26_004513 [Claviceps purpurea]
MAAEHGPEHASTDASEERTEPFSQSEIEARCKGTEVGEPDALASDEHVPLDVLQLEDHHHKQGIRILVRPLATLRSTRSVSPGSDNCQWLALRAEVASTEQPQHKVLAVTQTPKDIKFSVRIPGESEYDSPRPPLWCELYYDPASDQVIFLNKSDVPISLPKLSPTPTGSPDSLETHSVNPGHIKALRPGTWRIEVRHVAVLDFRILEKRPVVLYQARPALVYQSSSSSSSSSSLSSSPSLVWSKSNSSMKRPQSPDAEEHKANKRRCLDVSAKADDGAIMLLQPAADPFVFTLPDGSESNKELSFTKGHALLEAEQGQTTFVPRVCEYDEYHLTKRDPIASTNLSAVYTAHYSRIPDEIVTVKVLKTRVANVGDSERNVIRQADMWLRECQSQEDLQHESIVRYYGGDARFLSLYMEHVDAQDLAAANRWRNRQNECFKGTRDDASRILRDIAGALGYIHERKLVHNDIKPTNILYSPERGAVLCDFGLSTPASNSHSSGGTPYYVPPEFIGTKLRGPASDVWALGVTMLYVLRKITYPESRANKRHHKPLYWLIGGINNSNVPQQKQYGNGLSAVSQMREWLEEIFDAREILNTEDRLERLVKDMLTPNPNNRITMKKVLQELLSSPALAGAF